MLTIREQRLEVTSVLAENPSLRSQLGEILEKAYVKAWFAAQRETDLPEETFPAECPWTFDQAMNGEPAPGLSA